MSSPEEFKAIFGGIIALIVAIISLIGIVWKQHRDVKDIHHQTNNNSGKSMKDHVDQSYYMNQAMNRKFDEFARQMIPVMMDFRDKTNEHLGKLDTKLDGVASTVKKYHGE